jgi:hypothetical protein
VPTVELNPPFRWDLVTPDQLGSMLRGIGTPKLWFLDDLVACAGKVVARSGNGDLVFVGRSLDSMFDLLSGVLAEIEWDADVRRAPFSFARAGIARAPWGYRPLTPAEHTRARRVLTEVGVDPHSLARRDRPVTFVDVVHRGSTFTELYSLLRAWIDEDCGAWPVIRRKLRFVGVTSRMKTSPSAFRWHQHAPWTSQLPARAVVNVSLDPRLWFYFGGRQTKLTRSYRPDLWLADGDGPRHDEETRDALAEATALVLYGRSPAGRHALARAMAGEPALRESWLRTLIGRLNLRASLSTANRDHITGAS